MSDTGGWARALFLAAAGLLLAHLVLLSPSAFGGPCFEPAAVAQPITVGYPSEQFWSPGGKFPLGVAISYSYDDDKAWRLSDMFTSLQRARIGTVRFPEGESADNYDWERHALERPEDWPGEAANDAERAGRTDYLEILGYAKRLGIEHIFFVVNLDGAFHAPGDREANLKRYAQKAARWVGAVRKAGYRVPYWEIGNEPYLESSYPLTAQEYARALQVFSQEMRAADPTILIGAAGPAGLKAVGFGNRLTAGQLRILREKGGYKKVCPGLAPAQCAETLKNQSPGSATDEAWWDVLPVQARGSFDFVAIHHYGAIDYGAARRIFWLTDGLQHLRAHLEHACGRPVPLALTEWNRPNEKKHKSLTEIEHALEIAVQLGNVSAGGVEFAHYWPLRFSGPAFKPLLTNEGEMTAVAYLFAMAGEMLPGSEVAQSMPGEGVYVLRMRRSGQEGALVVNTRQDAAALDMEVKALSGVHFVVRRLTAREDGTVKPPAECAEQRTGGKTIRLGVPAKSVTSVHTIL